jgi:GTP-binding nuclear protein Ran
MELGDLFKRSLQSTTPEFKLALVGDANVGKTSFIARHVAGTKEKRLVSALGAVVHPLVFYTNHGPIKFNVWDTIGQEKIGFVKDSYFINGKLLIGDALSIYWIVYY